MLAKITGANEKYTTKKYKCAHSVHNSKVLRTCLLLWKIWISRLLKNTGWFQICFHLPDTFLRLLNYERYVHVCIFSLYTFYFLLLSQQASIAMWTILISKSWRWLRKPKRSTSTLHHNKFTYLDYVFLLSSYSYIFDVPIPSFF